MTIGNRVQDQFGKTGKIIGSYRNFWLVPIGLTRTKKQWLQEQIIPFSEEELQEHWFVVELDTGGGSIQSCESKLKHHK